MIIDINDKKLKTENDDFWIAPDATVIGDVQMARDSSIWFIALLEEITNPLLWVKEQTFKITQLFIPIQDLYAELGNLLQLVIWQCFMAVK